LDLNLLVRELLEDLELVTAEKNAHITTDKLPLIEANPGQIRQVFQNIVSNAVKFSREGTVPRVHIACKKIAEKSFGAPPDDNGNYCLISIEDNGIGFDEKFVNNIFVLFERLHSKDAYEGTGIGLAISKKIIEKHNGLIRAESSPGQGSKFSFVLPLAQQATAATAK
ncbi:MAG: PAS domain-containing sensor histidine kinase, partial [Chitinophagaceae bacterium]